jgi:hypothetical protein
MSESYIYMHGAPMRARVRATRSWSGNMQRISCRGLAVAPAYRAMRAAGVPAEQARGIVWGLLEAERAHALASL